MHRSLLTALAVTTLLCFATRTAGAEAAAHTRPLPAAAQDCLADGHLDRRYTKAAVRKSIARLATKGKHRATCRQRLRRVLSHGGDGRLRGRGTVRAVVRDCGDNGWLDRKWTLPLLQSALRRLPTDMEDYSDCPQTLRAELRARRRER